MVDKENYTIEDLQSSKGIKTKLEFVIIFFLIYCERLNKKRQQIKMKYYETNFEEYLSSYDHYNMHPELIPFKKEFPKNISEFKNLIVYGPAGVGKYTQVLSILQAYSPSKLKYDKKISVTYEKQEKKKTSILSTMNASSNKMSSASKMSANTLKPKETNTSTSKKKNNGHDSFEEDRKKTRIYVSN